MYKILIFQKKQFTVLKNLFTKYGYICITIFITFVKNKNHSIKTVFVRLFKFKKYTYILLLTMNAPR